jgi:DNA-binding response OmpR family regulator
MLSLGIDAFLPKPLEVRQLVEAVKQIIKPNAGTSDTFTEK